MQLMNVQKLRLLQNIYEKMMDLKPPMLQQNKENKVNKSRKNQIYTEDVMTQAFLMIHMNFISTESGI